MVPVSTDGLFYLNGEWLPPAQATVPVLDRGFLFGDGVYEVIPVYAGQPFRLGEHLHRLQRSLDGVRIRNPHDEAGWRALLQEAIERNGSGDRSLYLQVTRGVSGRRKHPFPDDARPTVLIMCPPLEPPAAAMLENGVSAIARADPRWQHCDIKSTALLANVLLTQEAYDLGANETLLIRDGQLVEGAASNVFLVHRGVVSTPPHGNCLLAGVTRDLIVELAPDAGLELQQRELTENELYQADEIWISSSTRELLPITLLDGKPVGDGQPGPVWRTMYEYFQSWKRDWLRAQTGVEAS